MCQLLGMNCNTPTDIVFSFEGFRKRGGQTDHHQDGFGIAFFEEAGVRVFHDNKPSATSPVAELIKNYPIKSENVIAHIRKATQGTVSLANTHPFIRELWGQYWVFAHNGNLKDFPSAHNVYFNAVGETDSEQAFCHMMEHLRQKFPHKPDTEDIISEVKQLASHIRQYGTFNFILSNGKIMLAHCSTHLHYIVRQAPFGEAHLADEDLRVNFAHETTPEDRVAVIATLPLTTNENWTAFQPETLLCFRDGQPIKV